MSSDRLLVRRLFSLAGLFFLCFVVAQPRFGTASPPAADQVAEPDSAEPDEDCCEPESTDETDPPGPFAHSGPIMVAAFSPDGKTLVTGTGRSGEVCLWDVATGKKLRDLDEHGGGTTQVAFSPDGRWLASAGWDGEVRLWEVATGKLRRLPTAPLGVTGLAFSPDSKILATATLVGQIRSAIRMHDLATGKVVREIPGQRIRRSELPVLLAYARDGKSLFAQLPSSLSSSNIVAIDPATGRTRLEIQTTSRSWGSFALSPTGSVLTMDDDEASPKVLLVAADNGNLIHSWKALRHHFFSPGLKPQQLAISPNGRLFALADGPVFTVWETAGGRKERFRSAVCSDAVCCVAFAPDGRSVFAGNMDGTGKIFDLTGGAKLGRKLTVKELAALWNDLAGDDGFAVDRAVWSLAAIPSQSVPFVCNILRPAPDVQRRIARLISDLDSNRFAVRQRATNELEQLGLLAEVQLSQALKRRPGLDITRRLEGLLKKLETNARRMRALEVLAYAGTPEARRAMVELGIWNAADVAAASGRRTPP